MAKIIKITFIALFTLILLIAIGIVALALFVDPNRFKSEISAEVYKQTGRHLTINGDIHWSFYPTIGLQVNDLVLSNAVGFGTKPFAQLGMANITLRLSPLLQGKIEAGTLSLYKLTLNLTKNSVGITNWQDLMPSRPAHAPVAVFAVKATTPNLPMPSESSQPSVPSHNASPVQIHALDVHDATVYWDNQQINQQATVAFTSLNTGALNFDNRPFNLRSQFSVQCNQPALGGSLSVDAQIQIDGNVRRYQANQLNLLARLSNGKDKRDISIALKAQGNVDLMNQTLEMKPMTLSVNQLAVQGEVVGTRILSIPELVGRISIGKIDVPTFLTGVGLTAPSNNLKTAQGNFAFAVSKNRLSITNLQATVGESNFVGAINFIDFANKIVQLDLSADKLRVEDYLPSAQPLKIGMNTHAALQWLPVNVAYAVVPMPAPTSAFIDWMRQLTLRGQLQVTQLLFGKVMATNFKTAIDQHQGVLALTPITASFYEGAYQGDVRIDVRQPTLGLNATESLSKVNVQSLLKSLADTDFLSGLADVTSTLTAQGNDLLMMKQSLNGHVKLQVNNGVIHRISLVNQLQTAFAMFKNTDIPRFRGESNTEFMSLTANIDVRNGVASNTDLVLMSPLLKVTGKGNIDLVSNTIDYRLEVGLANSTQLPQILALTQLAGGTIPVTVSGSIDNPRATPDYPLLLKRITEKRLGKQLGDVQGQLDDKLDKVSGGKFGKKLKSLLSSR